MKKRGFTLIELLIVISIIAVIIGMTTANFLGARGRARDAKRKADLKEVKNALRLYYNDYQVYPTAGNPSQPWLGCGSTGIHACPNTIGCAEFAAWGAGGSCTDASMVTYMKRLPRDPSGTNMGFLYYNAPTSDDFCLTTTLENAADAEIKVSQTRCTSACGANCNAGNLYCMCAD